MPKLSEDGKRTDYEDYDDYVKSQDSKYHDYDCPNCLKINRDNIKRVREKGAQFNKVLDIGARDASYFDELKKEGIACKGIDISPRSVEYTKSKGRDVILGDVINLSKMFNEKFDLIVSNHTLEHFLEPKKVMDECYKVLGNGGYMVIRLPHQDVITDTKNYAHAHVYTEIDLRKLLNNAGFTFIEFGKSGTYEFFIIVKKIVFNQDSLPLYEMYSREWEKKFNEVMSDSFIQMKYNRERRIQDKIKYIKNFLPEVTYDNGLVVDIGPGPGEFLEICRYYGNDTIGIDAKIGDCEMGEYYLKLSMLMTERQKININYVGFENLIEKNEVPFKENSIKIINSQGSWEQIFKDYLVGVPVGEREDCRKLVWVLDDKLKNLFNQVFSKIFKSLVVSGICFIYHNGCSNFPEYKSFLLKVLGNFSNLEINSFDDKRMIKIKKLK